MKLSPPTLEHICDFDVTLDPLNEMGTGRAGQRRIIPIVGGKVSGPHLQGELMHLGADWQTIWADGTAELDTRYGLRTHDGAVIDFVNYGYRHGPPDVMAAVAKGEEVSPDAYYMRTHARLETGDPRYAWVNNTLFLGTGARLKQAVVLSLFAVR